MDVVQHVRFFFLVDAFILVIHVSLGNVMIGDNFSFFHIFVEQNGYKTVISLHAGVCSLHIMF